MARQQMQKNKLLLLKDYFEKNCDESHGASTADIIDYLEGCGISCERKSVYSDIEALRSYGMDISQERDGKRTVYYLLNRTFETPELKMLVDIIGASRFVTPKKSEALIRKIETLCSVHDAKTLSRYVYLTGRVKAGNEIIYLNVDKIHTSFNEGCAITFKYFFYNAKKEKVYRHDGKKYEVVPVALVWNNDKYYLIAIDREKDGIKHFRVDKMDSIKLGERMTERESELCRNYDTSRFSKVVFDMFGGEAERVELSVPDRLVDAMLDRFGMDLVLLCSDNGDYKFSVEVELSPTFYAWVDTFGGEVKILSPEKALSDYRGHIEKLVASINGDKK